MLDVVGLNVVDRGTDGLLPVVEVSVPVVELPLHVSALCDVECG